MTDKYCQYLEILIVNKQYYLGRLPLTSNERKADGLQVFHCGEWDPIPLPNIIRLMTQFDYHKYLEEIVISGEQFEHHPFIEYNFGHQFQQLRILQYSNDDAEEHDEVKRLLFSNQVAAGEYSTLHYIRARDLGRMELADAFSFLTVMLMKLQTINIRCAAQCEQYLTILDEPLEEFLEEYAPGITCVRLDGDTSAVNNKALGQIVLARLLGYVETKLDDGLITLIMSADPPLKTSRSRAA
ncbi:hypothetical protein BJV82DRAFT_583101 [Fennellomyces sp. T-0311]|nr:hypothetical protein BJV82DRAFT_583101 [Fennellomyces sp. T-0311]